MYTEQDRVYVRKFLGFGAIFLQADPRLENALSATQSVADGGTRPDSTTENAIKALIYGDAGNPGTAGISPSGTPQTGAATPARRGLLQVEAQIAKMDIFLGTSEVGRGAVKADPARETVRLRIEGYRLARQLADALGLRAPRRNVFSNRQPDNEEVFDDPFVGNRGPTW